MFWVIFRCVVFRYVRNILFYSVRWYVGFGSIDFKFLFWKVIFIKVGVGSGGRSWGDRLWVGVIFV